jgi:hypothetical protein
MQLTEHLAATYLDGADLGDATRRGGAAGGFEVDDDERHFAQRDAQLIKRALDGQRPRC